MITQTIQAAINEQINAEFDASYTYLAMSADCERKHLHGTAKWLRLQSREEYGHGMRLFDFLLARDCKVELKSIEQPDIEYESLLSIFEKALKQEEEVSRRIDELYKLAFAENAFATLVELQWFLTEQVGEEHVARDIVAKLRMVKNDPAALLELDRELGNREAEAV